MWILALTQNIILNLLRRSATDFHTTNEVIIFRLMMDLLSLTTAKTTVLFRTALTSAGACVQIIFVKDFQAQSIKNTFEKLRHVYIFHCDIFIMGASHRVCTPEVPQVELPLAQVP